MRFPIYGVVRLAGILCMTACGVAIAMARLEPTPARFRLAVPPPYGVLNGYLTRDVNCEPSWLDRETGETRRVRLPEGDRIDYASCSPWQDEEGDYQVVGRWTHRLWNGRCLRADQFGVARYAMPGGKVLDQIPVDITPASLPCWSPGARARVIYAGNDGALHRIDFDDSSRRGESPRPVMVEWRVPPPGAQVSIRDPIWPADARFGGRLLVSLGYRRVEDEKLFPARLWWLQLDSTASYVIAAGPFTDRDCPVVDDTRAEERLPNLATTPDGHTVLAYLSLGPRQVSWDLNIVSVRFEAPNQVPEVRTREARHVASRHLATLPTFAADGRSLYAILEAGPGQSWPRIERFPTTLEPDASTRAEGDGPPLPHRG